MGVLAQRHAVITSGVEALRPALAFTKDDPILRGRSDTPEFRLLNDFQHGFPLLPRPYARIAELLGIGEERTLHLLRHLAGRGYFSRIGAVFAPHRIGASTLAALAAPPEMLEAIAARVSAYPEVNHNYEREHRYNLWFVIAAPDRQRVEQVCLEIELATGCPVISLPLVEEFHIDLGFDLNGGSKHTGAARPVSGSFRRPPSATERKLIAALEPGLDLVPQPFAALASRTGSSEQEVLGLIKGWLASGVLKRFGVVVRHHELGYRANAMVVWDVPDDEVCDIGLRLAREPEVTLCYRRQRHPPQWRYNLFCMIHAAVRADAHRRVDRLRRRLALGRYPHAVLITARRFKQCSARYAGRAETHRG
jgi:DNA-binding Lrp family transcriptional regulator